MRVKDLIFSGKICRTFYTSPSEVLSAAGLFRGAGYTLKTSRGEPPGSFSYTALTDRH